jgi:putative oxidoreductase
LQAQPSGERSATEVAMNDLQDIAALLGRTLLGLMFFVSGVEKLGAFADTSAFMSGVGLPAVNVLLVLAIVVEIAGGGAICLGWRTRLAALALLLFTVVVTMVFHRFWSAAPDQAVVQRLMFMKNLSIMGGLVLLSAFGPGTLSFHYEGERAR